MWFTEGSNARAGISVNRPYAAIISNHSLGGQLELYVLNSLHPRFLLARHDPTGQTPRTWRERDAQAP
ncbi:hypothetical protein [Deinococcus ficus]|uniref:hypothetical protein n=1 Tax=Deinococcus ficus TaxID=317577 RepID=UPI0003B5694B|nr:hypothetical protein [Deinococcus ficus]